jgi:predicted phage-related endonuclease
MANIKVGSEAEWHAIREQNIGGSEIASLFYLYAVDGQEQVFNMFQEVPANAICLGCLSPYKTGYRLWQEKAGKLKPDDLSENERVIAGQFMEPAMAEWAKSKFDLKIRKVRRYMSHNDVRGWGASLDYELISAGMPPVEFKNVDGLQFRNNWIAEGDEIIMPPLHINLQLQTQIGVTDADYGLIICCVGGNELKLGQVQRHEPTQAKIAEAIAAFWKAIDAGFEPSHLADYETVAKMHSAGDKDAPVVDLTDVEIHIAHYVKWKKHFDFVEKQISRAKGRVTEVLGKATKGKSDRFAITWVATHIPEKLIPAKVQVEKNYRGAFIVKEV